MKRTVKTLAITIFTLAFMIFASSCGTLDDIQDNVQKNTSEVAADSKEAGKKDEKSGTKTDKGNPNVPRDNSGKENTVVDPNVTKGNGDESSDQQTPKTEAKKEIPQKVISLVGCFDSFDKAGMQSLVGENVKVNLQTRDEFIDELLKNVKDDLTKEIFASILSKGDIVLRESSAKHTDGNFEQGTDEETYAVTTKVLDVAKAVEIFESEIAKIDIKKEAKEIGDKLLKDGTITAETSAEDRTKLIEAALDEHFGNVAAEALKKAKTKADGKNRNIVLKKSEENVIVAGFDSVISVEKQ